MPHPNRLLVTDHDSHITEERRIEEKMVEVDFLLTERLNDLQTDLSYKNWNAVVLTTSRIAEKAAQLWLMEQILQDVKHINEQFARIQAHIDRIEATENE